MENQKYFVDLHSLIINHIKHNTMKNSEEPISPTYKFVECNGLTKREHFAGLAMQGYLSNPSQVDYTINFIINYLGLPKETNYSPEIHYTAFVAKMSIGYADALLAELEKPQP